MLLLCGFLHWFSSQFNHINVLDREIKINIVPYYQKATGYNHIWSCLADSPPRLHVVRDIIRTQVGQGHPGHSSNQGQPHPIIYDGRTSRGASLYHRPRPPCHSHPICKLAVLWCGLVGLAMNQWFHAMINWTAVLCQDHMCVDQRCGVSIA